jgi:hypothetical protein
MGTASSSGGRFHPSFFRNNNIAYVASCSGVVGAIKDGAIAKAASILAFPSSMQVAPRHLEPGHGGHLVCGSPTDAEHHESTLRLSFEPREDEVYYLYYKVGGGGCHTLHVHDATLGVILWDYPDKRLSKQIRESHNNNNNNNTQLGLPEVDHAGSGTHEQT